MRINPRTYDIFTALNEKTFHDWKEDDRARAGWSHE